MESGRVRRRRVHEDALELMQFQCNFTLDQFDGFKFFFEEVLQNGTLGFEMDVLDTEGEESEEAVVTKHFAFWENYTFTRSDGLFSVSGVLELQVESPVSGGPEPDFCAIQFTTDLGVSGDSFDCYFIQDPVVGILGSGNGWDEAWEGESNYLGLQAYEPFQNYGEQNPIATSLDRGSGWDGAALIGENFALSSGPIDLFEQYDEGSVVGDDISGGLFWDGASDIATNVYVEEDP